MTTRAILPNRIRPDGSPNGYGLAEPGELPCIRCGDAWATEKIPGIDGLYCLCPACHAWLMERRMRIADALRESVRLTGAFVAHRRDEDWAFQRHVAITELENSVAAGLAAPSREEKASAAPVLCEVEVDAFFGCSIPCRMPLPCKIHGAPPGSADDGTKGGRP
jgi:hypothetical protein